MRTILDIIWVILWCNAVYVCSYDWENCRDVTDVNTFCE